MLAIRYCRAALPALLSTAALLFGMQLLIHDEAVYAAESRPPFEFLPPVIQPDPPPHKPVEPPPRDRFKPTDTPGTPRYPVAEEPFPRPDRPEATRPSMPDTTLDFDVSDRPLITTIRLTQNYPPSMAQRGIEGYVDVQFDVLANGVVTNVRVIESSHTGFERSAKDAARRFQFEPRMVDGQPVDTFNVNYRFTYRLDQD